VLTTNRNTILSFSICCAPTKPVTGTSCIATKCVVVGMWTKNSDRAHIIEIVAGHRRLSSVGAERQALRVMSHQTIAQCG
jgi:hypothetical protein